MITIRKSFFGSNAKMIMHTNPESYCNRHICQNHQYDSFNRNVQLYFDTKFLLQFLAFLDFSKRFLENAGLKMCVTIIQPSLSCYSWSGLSRRDTSTDRGVDIKINRSLIGQRGFNAFKAKKLIAHEAITSLCASTIQSSKGKERLWRCRRRGRQPDWICENLCKEHESVTFIAVSVTTADVRANKRHFERTTESQKSVVNGGSL